MSQINKIIQIISIFILTLFGMYLSQSMYSDEYTIQNIYESAFGNNEARIDVYNTSGARIKVLETEGITSDYPVGKWCKKDNGDNCAVIKILPRGKWQEYKIKLDILADGKTKVMLRGPYRKVGTIIRPILVDYQNLQIDGKTYLPEKKSIWHEMYTDKTTETSQISVKKGQQLSFSLMIRRHPFAWKDLEEFYHFNLLKFLGILMQAFLVSCVIVWVCSRIVKRYSYRCLFGIIIIFALTLPLINLSKDEISVQENRTLAKFPKIINKEGINTKFGQEFNEWLGDRFWGRNQLIDLRFSLLHRINGRLANEEAFVGDDGWMFETNGTKYVDPLEKQEKQIERNVEILKRFATLLKGVKIYLVVDPDRNEILKRYWEGYYPPRPKINREKEYQDLLRGTDIHLIPFYDELVQMNEEYPVFYKEDSHLNRTGSETVLRECVFNALKNDEPKISQWIILRKEKVYTDYNKNGISVKLGMTGKENSTYLGIALEIRNDKGIWESKVIFQSEMYLEGDRNMYELGNTLDSLSDKKIAVIGPCYSNNIFSIVKKLFREAILIRANAFNSFTADVRSFIIEKIKNLVEKNSVDYIIIFENNEALSAINEAIKEL